MRSRPGRGAGVRGLQLSVPSRRDICAPLAEACCLQGTGADAHGTQDLLADLGLPVGVPGPQQDVVFRVRQRLYPSGSKLLKVGIGKPARIFVQMFPVHQRIL